MSANCSGTETEIELATLLAETLSTNPSYVKYLTAKEIVMSNKIYLEKINNFRKIQIEMEEKKLNGEIISFQDEKMICDLYTELATNEITADFIIHEKIVLETLNKVYEIIGNSISISLEN